MQERPDIVVLQIEQEALEEFKESLISLSKLIEFIGQQNKIDLIDYSNIYTQKLNLDNSLITLLKYHPELLNEIKKERILI